MGNTDFALEVPGVFDWGDVSPPSSQQVLAASASKDVFAALFSSYTPKGGLLELAYAGGLPVEVSNATIRVVGVPEPGPLTLFALGLVGVVLSWRRSGAHRTPP